MQNSSQLETCANELVTAISTLSSYSRRAEVMQGPGSQPKSNPEDPREIEQARSCILSTIGRIRMLICEPTELLEHLTSQMQIVACLRWLGEFQILACIPLVGSVPIKDLADLSGVPETQLGRVVRLTATAGFLQVSHAADVAHTPLSAPFVTNPSLLDALMFLAETAAPAAMQMAAATQRFGDSRQASESAYNLSHGTIRPFHTAHADFPKLGRQWSSFLHYAAGLHAAEDINDILTQLNWSNISLVNRCIVEVGAKSTLTGRSLAEMHPDFRIVVQIHGSDSAVPSQLISTSDGEQDSPRITVTHRPLGTRQVNTDVAIYILHLPPSHKAVLAELQIHFCALRENRGMMVILTSRLLPEVGTLANPEVEAVARSRGLSLFQLGNEAEFEMADLLALIDTVRDGVGKLTVTNKLRSPNNVVAALVVEYQVYVKV